MNKKLIIIMIIVMLLATGCQEKTLQLGVIGTMTGDNSDLSISGRRGIELAQAEINSNGGINGMQVELVVKNDFNNPTTAENMLYEFIQQDIQFVIGPYTSNMMLAIIDDVNANDILYIAPTVSADSLSQSDDHFLRAIASTKEQADILVRDIAENNHKNVVVILDERNLGFVNMLVKNFNEQLSTEINQHAKIIEINPTNNEEIIDAVNELAKDTPDAVFTIFGGEHCAKFAQELYKSNINIQQYGPLWSNTPELIHKGGTAVEGMKIVGAIDYDTPIGDYADFQEKYFNRFGEVPTFASMYSYESLYALKEAFEASNEITVKSVKNAIIDIGTYHGVQEDFIIDAYGDNIRPYHLFEIREGKIKRIKNE